VGRVIYRVRQFLLAHAGAPDPQGVERVKKALSPALFSLFRQMLPFEQAHALRVFDRLIEQGDTHPDLLTAALLHDVGKARYPLKPWERASAVLAKKFFPGRVVGWGQGEPHGLKAGVVVAEQHARWGAEMAEAAGGSDLAVRLIACHQDQAPTQLSEAENVLLSVLQSVDEIS
jgi:putative nucleotidyltransferase with HDIG domain